MYSVISNQTNNWWRLRLINLKKRKTWNCWQLLLLLFLAFKINNHMPPIYLQFISDTCSILNTTNRTLQAAQVNWWCSLKPPGDPVLFSFSVTSGSKYSFLPFYVRLWKGCERVNEVLEGHATPPAALSVTACQSCSPLQKRKKKKSYYWCHKCERKRNAAGELAHSSRFFHTKNKTKKNTVILKVIKY